MNVHMQRHIEAYGTQGLTLMIGKLIELIPEDVRDAHKDLIAEVKTAALGVQIGLSVEVKNANPN